jgi:hypothetical protein
MPNVMPLEGQNAGPIVGCHRVHVAPDGEADDDQDGEATGLDHGEDGLQQRRGSHPADVDPRQQYDRRDREHALPGEADLDRSAGQMHRGAEEDVRRDTGNQHGDETRKCGADGGYGARLDHREQRPAIQEPGQRRQSFAQVDVESTRAREHCAQLAVGEHAEDEHQRGDRPDEEQEPGRTRCRISATPRTCRSRRGPSPVSG